MSNQRKDAGKDPLVTDIYEELASERAPDHLNERVLRLAKGNGRTRYSVVRAWTRPAAWAATIGLSLAIVLELTRLPPIDIEGTPAEANRKKLETPTVQRVDSVSMDEFVPEDMSVLREAENMARVQAGPDQAPTLAHTEVGETKQLESGGACPEKVRESAESWFDCIAQLRESGRHGDAEDELREFRKIFPDFVPAVADR
jgi:hypothetical protein